MKKWIIPAIMLGALVACKSTEEATDKTTENDTNVVEANQTISMDYLDQTTRPQDDFFQFANGTWVKNNPVPASESRWGSFNELDQENMKKLTAILEDAKNNGVKENGTKLIGDYYASYLDMNRRDELKLDPIKAILEKVSAIQSHQELPDILAMQHTLGIGSAFRFGVSQDMKKVDQHIASFGQGGLTLPNRDYYLEEEYDDIRDAYQKHIVSMLVLAGIEEKEGAQMAQDVFRYESNMAVRMLKPAEMRNPENRYHKVDRITGLGFFGDFDFSAYLEATGIAHFDSINIGQPEYAEFIGDYLTSMPIEKVRNYLYWKTLDHYAGHLSSDFVAKNFEFYGETLSGKTQMKPINERAIREITYMEFGELLGRAFVEKHYSAEAQETINELVDNLLIVFQSRIRDLEWMSEETKEQALIKLNAIGRKLGFPEEWEDFSTLEFNPKTYIGNVNKAAMHSFQKNIEKLKKPVDTKEWGIPAHMVNAYYHPLLNEIAFPAGIMQPPFFSANYEDAVNYGRIGMVIGHEFTHGFDDNGSRFDASGNFKNWWTPSDRELFDARTETLGNTFANFCPIDGHCVNPQLTMGENIADLGGLTLAYHAYTRTDEFKSGEKRNGFTPAQRFFIAYAQLWKINFTDAELKKRIATDPHSPGMYRVNGPLMNCPEFFEAFNVKEGDPMRNKEGKVAKIW